MFQTISQKRKHIILGVLIVLGVFLVYGRTINSYFLSNDFIYLSQASAIHEPTDLFRLFTTVEALDGGERLYRPLASLSFVPEFHLWGLRPAGYHISNMILHALSGILIFWIVFRITKKTFLSFLCGFVFALYPINAGSVSWISSRDSLLSSAFLIGSFLLYIYFLAYREASSRTKNMTWSQKITYSVYKQQYVFYGLSLVVFILSLLSKDLGVVFPFVLLAFDYFFRSHPDIKLREVFQKQSLCYVPYAVLALAFFSVQFSRYQIDNSFQEGVLGFIKLPTLFIFEILNRDVFQEIAAGLPLQLMAFLIIVLLVFSVREFIPREKRTNRSLLLFSIAWMFLLAIPGFRHIQNFDLRLTDNSVLYLSAIGFCAFLSFLLISWELFILPSRKIQYVVGICIVLFLGFISFKNTLPWTQAGDLSRQIMKETTRLYPEIPENSSIYFVNVPSAFAGAPVYRAGLKQSIELLYNKEIDVFSVDGQGKNSITHKEFPQKIRSDANNVFILTWDPDKKILHESFNLDSVLNRK